MCKDLCPRSILLRVDGTPGMSVYTGGAAKEWLCARQERNVLRSVGWVLPYELLRWNWGWERRRGQPRVGSQRSLYCNLPEQHSEVSRNSKLDPCLPGHSDSVFIKVDG